VCLHHLHAALGQFEGACIKCFYLPLSHARSQDFQRVGAPRVDPGFLHGDDGGAEAPSEAWYRRETPER